MGTRKYNKTGNAPEVVRTRVALTKAATKAARARRAVEQFREENTEVVDRWESLKSQQEAAELALKELAADKNTGGEWRNFGLEVIVTPHAVRTVDVVGLLRARPNLIRFTSVKHGPLFVVRLAAYDAARDADLIDDELDNSVVTHSEGSPRVQVRWTKVG